MNKQIFPVINDYDLVRKTSIQTYMATTWSDKKGPVRLATNVNKKINSLKDMMILFKRSFGSEH